jgi:DNA-binding response OmpR family regulator
MNSSKGIRPDLKSAAIMLVDDEPTTLDVIELFLRDAGYGRFTKTTDARRVLELLAAERPDVLLLNLMMPKLDGIQLLNAINARPELRDIPVIIVSSSSDADTKHQALEHGAADFLCKPVDASELEMRVQNTLAARAYRDWDPNRDGSAPHGDRSARSRPVDAAASRSFEPLVSRLDENDSRSRAILVSFVGRLQAKRLAMEASFEAGDFEELVALAHWLKGAAGTVGFDAFTQPAETLRLLAQDEKASEIEASLQEIRDLAQRVVLAGDPEA